MQTNGFLSRTSKSQWVLRPQDLAVALKCIDRIEQTTYQEFGLEMLMSQFEAHMSTQRLIAAGLVVRIDGVTKAVKPALRDFVLHGASYAYPAVRTEITVGFPTAHAAEPLKSLMMFGGDMPPIWPSPLGAIRGVGILPLYRDLPFAAMQDSVFYERLALFDALRIGQARERKLVSELLAERLV